MGKAAFNRIAIQVMSVILKDMNIKPGRLFWPNSKTFESFPILSNKSIGDTHLFPFPNGPKISFQRAVLSSGFMVKEFGNKCGHKRKVLVMAGSFKKAAKEIKRCEPVLKGYVEGYYIFKTNGRRDFKNGIDGVVIKGKASIIGEDNIVMEVEEVFEAGGVGAARVF